jgi:peroxiredoxin
LDAAAEQRREVFRAALRAAKAMDASLLERLAHIVAAMRASPSSYSIAVEHWVARLQKVGAGSGVPGPGEAMPAFLLPDDEGRLVGLDELLQKGPVSIAFHRGHWCSFCRLSLWALATAHAKASEFGGQIVAISPERQEFTRKHKAEAGAPFQVLSDIDNAYAFSLNLGLWAGDELIAALQEGGNRLPQFHNNEDWTLPIPANFVVGTDGIIKARFVDPDYRRRMEIDDLLAALRAAS